MAKKPPKDPVKVNYITYSLVNGIGPKWLCHCVANGTSRLIFSGETEEEAIEKAKAFAIENLDTLERRALLKRRAEEQQRKKKNDKEEPQLQE